jgi:hypothetical protein
MARGGVAHGISRTKKLHGGTSSGLVWLTLSAVAAIDMPAGLRWCASLPRHPRSALFAAFFAQRHADSSAEPEPS